MNLGRFCDREIEHSVRFGNGLDLCMASLQGPLSLGSVNLIHMSSVLPSDSSSARF